MPEPLKLENGILPGVQKQTVEKIIEAGFPTVSSLAMQTPKDLAGKAGITEDTAEKAIKKAQQAVSGGFITAQQLRDERNLRHRLKTGSAALDELIGGGIESGTTTEISGGSANGKTQIAQTLSVLAQIPVDQGGLGGEVAWIDMEDTFSPQRVAQIASSRGFDPEAILKGIHHAYALNTDHQRFLMENLFDLCNRHPIKLIIVDGILSHLRSEYVGRGNLSDRQGELGVMLQILLKVAVSTGATIVYTNQVMDQPIAYGDPTKPAGGHRMAHAAILRLQLRKGRDNARVARLIDSSYLPAGEAVFIINEKGIDDVPEGRRKKEETEDGS